MCKTCWTLTTLLLLVLAGTLYKFIVAGSTQLSADGRTAIVLTAPERDLVLTEMRGFLVASQAILAASNTGDMKTVAEAARKAGMAGAGEVPVSLIGKLPVGFKTLGFDTHGRFDQLALDAESLGDAKHSQTQLAELMNNCLACHNGFRFEVEGK